MISENNLVLEAQGFVKSGDRCPMRLKRISRWERLRKSWKLNWQNSRFTTLDSPVPAAAKQESNGVYPVKHFLYLINRDLSKIPDFKRGHLCFSHRMSPFIFRTISPT